MSLVGNLADLGLGDIFQIVSLSRRSGTLRLDTSVESGEIVFISGKVVAASRSRPPHTVGDVLLHMGIVSPTRYQEMLAAESRGYAGEQLFTDFGLDADQVDRALESLLSRIVYEMFEWDEGTFSFVLSQDPPLWTGFMLGAARAVLPRGLNPQYLAIEGARIRDERTKEDPLEFFLARGRPARESSSQATAELSSALRSAEVKIDVDDVEASAEAFMEAPSVDENIIPFPQARRKQADATLDVPPPARIMPSPAPMAEQRATPPLPALSLTIPPDSVFATVPATRSGLLERTLLVVDDDVTIGRFLATELGHSVAAVHVVSRVGEAIDLVERLSGQQLILAVDLIMPRADGRGILGGVEIIERLRERDASCPVIAFSDYPNQEAEARARALGLAALLGKPKKLQVFVDDGAKTPSEPMRQFVRALSDALEQSVRAAPPVAPPAPVGARNTAPTPAPPAAPSPPFTLGELDVDDATMSNLVEHADRDFGAARQDTMSELTSLRAMLAELIDPANRDTITLLVLRYASDVVERGGLFLATRRAFVGLGGFLNTEESEHFVARVRRIQVPVEHDSVFAKVVQYRAALRAPLADTPANRALLEGLGGPWHHNPTLAIPIVSGDRVAAILFGDNPSGKPLGATDSLEIFLQQAGLAMDRALLERRLEESKKRRD